MTSPTHGSTRQVRAPLLPGYRWRTGTGRDQGLLLRFMQATYRELYPDGDLDHLADTIERHFSSRTPLWVVETLEGPTATVACLWLGTAIDQLSGDYYTHIFLLYVHPDHRRRGLGSLLLQQAEAWARNRGDRQIGLQVFLESRAALALYEKLGYQTRSLSLIKAI